MEKGNSLKERVRRDKQQCSKFHVNTAKKRERQATHVMKESAMIIEGRRRGSL